MSDLIVGAWRNGVDETTISAVEQAEAKEKSGFRLFPYELTAVTTARLLDAYDDFVCEILGDGQVLIGPKPKGA